MSGKASRRKGHDWEREVARRFREVVAEGKRGLQYQEGVKPPDVIAGPFAIECKKGKRTDIKGAMKQAEESSPPGTYAIAVTRDDRAPALVTVEMDDFLEMVGEWQELLGLLTDVACSGVELDDPRLRYVPVQIDRDTWEALQSLRAMGRG